MGILQKKTSRKSHKFEFGIQDKDSEPPSPYIFVPNLSADKLGFCYDPSLPIWANDTNSALFFLGVFSKAIFGEVVLEVG